MFFSSVPLYPDPPNWQQQANLQPADVGGSDNQHPTRPPPAQTVGGGGVGVGLVRPGSTADRARLAKIPPPELALKCPRCDSTNTKFCYFNNYSLSQPRHFCKTCRRYWTRGGALRNVPVGGGCRRNKKSKAVSRSSKSPKTGSGSTSTTLVSNTSNCSPSDMISQLVTPPLSQQLPILPNLHHSTNYNSVENGLNLDGTPSSNSIGCGGAGSSALSIGVSEQWRLQQLSFMANLQQSPGSFYTGEGAESASYLGGAGQLRLTKTLENGVFHQFGAVKLEEHQGLNGSHGSDHEVWVGGGNGWNTDLSGFSYSSASTSHFL